MMYPYEQYRNARVAGKNQLELMLMLYDGAIRFLRQASAHTADGEPEPAHTNFTQAKRIVVHLISALDPERAEPESRDLIDNLLRLYAFCYERIGMANLKKDPADADAALAVLEKLREGWAELHAGGWQPQATPPVDQATINIAQA